VAALDREVEHLALARAEAELGDAVAAAELGRLGAEPEDVVLRVAVDNEPRLDSSLVAALGLDPDLDELAPEHALLSAGQQLDLRLRWFVMVGLGLGGGPGRQAADRRDRYERRSSVPS
jgi:hypothetical protein